MPRRIDTTRRQQKWRYACPARQRHRDWRVVDGLFECRSCGETYRRLWDLQEETYVAREDVEVVGPHAASKGEFGGPTVE